MARLFGKGGFGRDGFGSNTKREPCFWVSVPTDNSPNVSPYAVALHVTIYGFSGLVNPASVVIEQSKNGGAYSDIFRDGVYASDFSNAYGRMQQIDPQRFKMYLAKNTRWDDDSSYIIRVTAMDEYGQQVTKDVPVEWGVPDDAV